MLELKTNLPMDKLIADLAEFLLQQEKALEENRLEALSEFADKFKERISSLNQIFAVTPKELRDYYLSRFMEISLQNEKLENKIKERFNQVKEKLLQLNKSKQAKISYAISGPHYSALIDHQV
jgi:hypothetical protein